MIKIVSFLEKAPRYHGAWSHFMDDETGASLPVFGMFDDGGDLVETAFLMQGLLAARQYFNGSAPDEHALHARISKLWESVEWDWYRAIPKATRSTGTGRRNGPGRSITSSPASTK